MRLPWNRSDELSGTDPILDRVLAAARAPGGPDELSGDRAALAAYRAAAHLDPTARRNPVNSRRLTARLATVAFAGTLGLGGVAAAYAGALPEVPQQVAHDVLGSVGVPDHANAHAKANAAAKAARKAAKASHAPEAEESDSDADGGKGPDVTGPAKAGLCNAWSASGKPKNEKATAFADLVTAAGGADKVEAFCADVAKKPSKSPKPEHSAKPSKSPKAHPSGRPSDAGKPSKAPKASHTPEPDESEDSD
jgi:hypothetical protein